jgi:hypothetical protein
LLINSIGIDLEEQNFFAILIMKDPSSKTWFTLKQRGREAEINGEQVISL